MRLKLILPTVDLTHVSAPTVCPRPDCGGQHFQHHQDVRKPLRDPQLDHATVERVRCVRCGHTFRVYPQGVIRAHTSTRLRGIAVMLYVFGVTATAGWR